jgi:hypothetical protein
MSSCRDLKRVPMFLVGTRDTVSDVSPQIFTEIDGKATCTKLHMCGYYETCATYGLNVVQVFTEACQTIVKQRSNLSCRPVPSSAVSHGDQAAFNKKTFQSSAGASTSTGRGSYRHQRSISALPINEPPYATTKKPIVQPRVPIHPPVGSVYGASSFYPGRSHANALSYSQSHGSTDFPWPLN